MIALLTQNISFRAADATERQELFARAFDEIIARVDACRIDSEFLQRNHGDLWVSVSLSPESGQAGIVITPEMIMKLATRGAYVDVDALT